MNRFFILIFLILLTFPCFSQDAGKYHIQNLTTDDGLPSNGIKGLQWDERTGFLWIATEAGMSRYNGVSFSNFTKANTAGLSHERMLYLVKNNRGSIYASDAGGNLLTTKDNAPISISVPGLSNLEAYKKRVYLQIIGEQLQQKMLSLLNSLGSVSWVNMVQVSDTSVALIIEGRPAYFISESKPAAVRANFPEPYQGIFLMNNQLFATDKEKKIFRVTNSFTDYTQIPLLASSGEPISIQPGTALLYWTPGMKDPILFSENNAWLLYDRQTHIEAKLICSAVPSYSYIRFAQYSDRNKTLFIGTDSKGIIVINENRVTHLKNPDTDIRDLNAYYSQVELANGNILTNEGHEIGLSKTNPSLLPMKGKFSFTVQLMEDTLLWYSQPDKENKLDLLRLYNYKTRQTTTFQKAGSVSGGFAIARSGNELYVASNHGLAVLRNDSLQYIFKPGSGKTEQQPPFKMLEFSPGVLGVASCDGLILYDINKRTVDTAFRYFGYCVRSLWKYKDYVFFSTYGKGFYIWKAGKVKAMPLDKNKFLLYAHCIVPDENGFCWISTNRGLFKAQLSDLIDAYEKDRDHVYYHYFGKNDGMQITEMNGGCAPCALQMKNKQISFPTMDGLLWVDPLKAAPLLPEGNIFIDAVMAGGRKINPDSLALRSLPFKTKDLVIKLGFSAWCNEENIYLEYRLDPRGEWIPVDVDKGSFITLNNLVPGKYKLQIRKLNGFGVDNYSHKEISFSIRTPWQQQWWFYALCILSVMGLIRLYLRFRTRQYQVRQLKLEKQVAEKTQELQSKNEILEKSNTINTRLISIISHDIITPLKFVTVVGNKLLEKNPNMTEDLQRETIQEITNTSQELQLLSTNILNWIKYQNEHRRLAKETFNVSDLVNQVLGLLTSLARQKNLRIENNVPASLEIQQFYEPLKILIYNLLTNAIQFTEKGTISINAEQTPAQVTISVKDEGVGMTSEQIQNIMADEFIVSLANVDKRKGNGLGYLIIKDLVKMTGAVMTIQSEKNKGTEVFIHLPMNGKTV